VVERGHEVVIVDDDPSVRVAFERQIRLMGHQAKSFEDPTEALSAIRAGAGCCVIVDLCMPTMSGLQLQNELTELGRPLPLIFVSGQGTVQSSVRAVLDGALDFLEKPVEFDVLKDAISKALSSWNSLTRAQSEHMAAVERFSRLTQRQEEVFRILISGASNKEIARRLDISERTVKAHRQALMESLGADSIADVYRLAAELGIKPAEDHKP
jgi:FixJ family two-component response regulator